MSELFLHRDELPDDGDMEGPGLLGSGDDLVRRQQEPVHTCSTEFDGNLYASAV